MGEPESRVGDYRTIDWVHDSVKDQFRKKKLRGIPGIRGVVVNTLDSVEGWVLVGIIGMTTLRRDWETDVRRCDGVDCLLY